MDEDELDRDIRDLLHHPARESAQDRAIAFAQRRLDRDMEEAARMRRGATRRRVGRVLIATALFILLAAAAATATDSHFLRDLLGKETPLADRISPISDGSGVTPTIDRFGEPASLEVTDSEWTAIQRTASANTDAFELRDRSTARVLLQYDDARASVTIAAAPTRNRSVCYIAEGDLSTRNCAGFFTVDEPAAWNVVRTPTGNWAVVGLVADEVSSVTILLDRGQRTALVRNNAFVWLAAGPQETPRGLEVELSNGDHRKIELTLPNEKRPVRPTE